MKFPWRSWHGRSGQGPAAPFAQPGGACNCMGLRRAGSLGHLTLLAGADPARMPVGHPSAAPRSDPSWKSPGTAVRTTSPSTTPWSTPGSASRSSSPAATPTASWWTSARPPCTGACATTAGGELHGWCLRWRGRSWGEGPKARALPPSGQSSQDEARCCPSTSAPLPPPVSSTP